MSSPWALVALSLVALALAPLLAAALQRRPALAAGLDGFVLASVGAVVVLHVVPHSAELLGAWAVLAAAAGLLLPIGLHRLDLALRGDARRGLRATRNVVVFTLLALGLAVHAAFDGAALVAHSDSLALGVLAHRLPAGLALWALVRPRVGIAGAVLLLVMYGGGTALGAIAGGALDASTGATPLALLQAFVAGSILHVVAEAPPLAPARTNAGRLAGLAGAALAALALALVSHEEGVVPGTFDAVLTLMLASAPALVGAFVLVGVLSAFERGTASLPGASSSRVRGAATGTAAGLVQPLCACKVGPLVEELAARGASPSATHAFLVAAPALGVPALLLSVRLLAWPLVLARVLAAALVALVAGITAPPAPARDAATAGASSARAPLATRLRDGLRHAFVDGVDHVGPWLFVGFLAGAALSTSMPPTWLASVPPLAHPLLAALVAFPLYLCAAGLTPVAAMLIALGLSPGGALALVLVGPATSAPALAQLGRRMGARAAALLGLVVLAGAALCGVALDAALGSLDVTLDVAPPVAADLGATEAAALVVLALLGVASLWRQGVRGALVQVMSPLHRHADDHAHGPACAHEHGPPLAPPVPVGLVLGPVAKRPLRVTLTFDPRSPPPEDPQR